MHRTAVVTATLLALSACSSEPTSDGDRSAGGEGAPRLTADASADGSSSADGSVAAVGGLPPSCILSKDRNADCAKASPDEPLGVVCRGKTAKEAAPFDMVLRLKCKYRGAAVGAGNVYCCPQRGP